VTYLGGEAKKCPFRSKKKVLHVKVFDEVFLRTLKSYLENIAPPPTVNILVERKKSYKW